VRRAGEPEPAELLRPIRGGVVRDWDALESLYHHIFYEQARGAAHLPPLTDATQAGLGGGRGGRRAGGRAAVHVQGACARARARRCAAAAALLTRAQPDRERLLQLLFEQFHVQGVHVADAPTLSVYAAGKLTGLAVDCGAGKTGAFACRRRLPLTTSPDLCPVFEGTPITHAARQLALGGEAQSERLRQLLGERGVALSPEQSQAAKEALCAVRESAEAAAAVAEEAGVEWTLPDGRPLRLPERPLAQAAELLFEPPGRAGLVPQALAAVALCAPEQRKAMLECVVLSGGGAAAAGFEARLVRELAAAAPSGVRPAAAPAPEYMHALTLRYAAFVGGCMLAKTVFPLNQIMSKRDYQEHGPGYRRS